MPLRPGLGTAPSYSIETTGGRSLSMRLAWSKGQKLHLHFTKIISKQTIASRSEGEVVPTRWDLVENLSIHACTLLRAQTKNGPAYFTRDPRRSAFSFCTFTPPAPKAPRHIADEWQLLPSLKLEPPLKKPHTNYQRPGK